MPNEVILQVHQLATASKKYKDIVFMDQAGNIIDENYRSGDHRSDNRTYKCINKSIYRNDYRQHIEIWTER